MTLLLGCLLIFLIHRVRSSQIHLGLGIYYRPSTYRWILYSHLSSTTSSTIRSTASHTLRSTDSSTILASMVFSSGLGESSHIREDAAEPAQTEDFTPLALGQEHRDVIPPRRYTPGNVVSYLLYNLVNTNDKKI
jgi:hypothetical protein